MTDATTHLDRPSDGLRGSGLLSGGP